MAEASYGVTARLRADLSGLQSIKTEFSAITDAAKAADTAWQGTRQSIVAAIRGSRQSLKAFEGDLQRAGKAGTALTGGLAKGLRDAERSARRARKEVVSLDDMLRKVAAAGAMWGGTRLATRLVGGAFDLVSDLGMEAESARARLQSLLITIDDVAVGASRPVASSIFEQLREDAARSIGGLSDFMASYQAIYAPARQAGASREQIRALTRQSIAAGFAFRGQEGIQYAPIDIQQALTAGVGDRTTPIVNQALRAINVTGEAFNKLSTRARIDTLAEAFAKLEPAISVFGETYEARQAQLADELRELGRTATRPIFDALRDTYQGLGDVIDRNRTELDALATAFADATDAVIHFATRAGGLLGQVMGLDTSRGARATRGYMRLAESIAEWSGSSDQIAGTIATTMLASAGVSPQIANALVFGYYAGGPLADALADRIDRETFGGPVPEMLAAPGWRGPIDPSETVPALLERLVELEDDAKPVKVELSVKIDKLEWGDERQMALALERALGPAIEQAASVGRRSRYGLRPMG